MSQDKQHTARFEIIFTQRSLVKSLFAMLSRIPGFAFNLLRGRLTRTSARYELEVSGSEKVIAMILRRCERLGVEIRGFEAVP
jgi:hypothetical protein